MMVTATITRLGSQTKGAARGPCVSDSPYIIVSRQSAAKWILELGIFKLGFYPGRVCRRPPPFIYLSPSLQIQYCHFHISELLAAIRNAVIWQFHIIQHRLSSMALFDSGSFPLLFPIAWVRARVLSSVCWPLDDLFLWLIAPLVQSATALPIANAYPISIQQRRYTESERRELVKNLKSQREIWNEWRSGRILVQGRVRWRSTSGHLRALVRW